MGIFDSMRARLMGNDAAAAWATPVPPDEVHIINPSTQEVIDRLLDEGRLARGVVVGVFNDTDDGNRSFRTRVHVRVRPRLRGDELGSEASLKAWVNWKVAALLEPGLEIPITFDSATATATGIETGLLAEELKPRFGESKQRMPGWTTETGLEGLTEVPAIVRDLRAPKPLRERKVWLDPNDPVFEPIAGVTWQQYVGVCARLDTKSNENNDRLAQSLGAPAGAWVTAAKGWQQRIMSTPALSLQFGEDVEAAKRG